MTAPNLNRPLVLETLATTPDGAGGRTESWSALGTLWGELKPRTGREANGAAGAVSRTGFRITVRAAPVGHSNRPVPGQRFRHGPRVFVIASVTESPGPGLYLTCIAQEEISL